MIDAVPCSLFLPMRLHGLRQRVQQATLLHTCVARYSSRSIVMRRRISVFRSFFKTVLAISIVMGVLPAYAAAAASSNDTSLPVAQLLNTDGTLNVNAGYSGPLDFSGYNVSLDRVRGPVFSPLMTLNAWDALDGGLNAIVYAIAINGSDI